MCARVHANIMNCHADRGFRMTMRWDQSIYAINFGCATGPADLGQLYFGLSGCATGLLDPGHLYIGLPGCTMGLSR